MSDKALVYSEEPLTHRMLVLYEIAGINGEVVEYFLRSLLSEGRVRHETVVKTRDDQVAKLFEREGPTGLIVTTTLPKWHAENETRMFSLTTRDDPEQTRSVLLALGSEAQGEDEDEPDLAPWHALQKWLELAGARDVELPFAASLARVVDCNEIRMRRDFTAIINLIRAHAILHQCNRRRDDKGRIVATLDDYAAIHELVADLVGEGVHAGVNPPIREIVMAVTDLQSSTGQPVSQAKLGTHLSLGKSVVSRRVKVAIEDGYLENLEMDRGRPAKLIPGLPLPDEQTVLPSPETLQMGEGVAA